jgi:hypothetical protein
MKNYANVVNLNDLPVVCDIEDVLADIVSLEPKIIHAFTDESDYGLFVAYENMLSLAMKRK